MKKTWTLTYESIPGDGEQRKEYKSFQDVKRKIRELISNIGVQRYIDEIRDGINVPYRTTMADFLNDYVLREGFYHEVDTLPSDDASDYPIETDRVRNDLDMYVDDDGWYDEEEESDELDDFDITIREDNLAFEYRCELSLRTNMVVMDDDEKEYDFKFCTDYAPKGKFRELYIELELTLNQPWGTSAYPLLILQALQNSEKHLKQGQLAIKTSIERKAIGRNIELLKKIGFNICHDRAGYYIPPKNSALAQEDLQTIVDSIKTNEALDDDKKRKLIDKLFEL